MTLMGWQAERAAKTNGGGIIAARTDLGSSHLEKCLWDSTDHSNIHSRLDKYKDRLRLYRSDKEIDID